MIRPHLSNLSEHKEKTKAGPSDREPLASGSPKHPTSAATEALLSATTTRGLL